MSICETGGQMHGWTDRQMSGWKDEAEGEKLALLMAKDPVNMVQRGGLPV